MQLKSNYAYNSQMDVDLIIEKLGGPAQVARICEIRPQAVSQWRSTGIPKARLMYLQLLRPDIFVPTLQSQEREAA